MRTEPAARTGGITTLGCFEVGGRIYALDVANIREIVRWQAVTPLPGAPDLIEGVIDLRGAVVPVVDLGRALGVDPVRGGARARIVVAEVDGLVVGFAVDAATGVMPIDPSALEVPPTLASVSEDPMTRAVVRRDGGEPIPLLSLERLLERVQALPSAGTEEAA
jgi:purine-binding chemotaxis protein CheW